MSWTDEKVTLLREFWGQGLSASQIAQRIGGVTRNAVIGKAHRLGLDSRPSPIRAGAAEGRPRAASSMAKRVSRPQVRARLPLAPPVRPSQPPPVVEAPPVEVTEPRVIAVPAAYSAGQALSARAGGPACKWPIGDPGEADFHFCGATAVEGRPYCPSHCAVAYIRRESRDSRNAA